MKFSLFIAYLFINFDSFSQNLEPINSDRPDQSEGTYTLTKGTFQFENGVLHQDQFFSNNAMLRYGVNQNFELRLISNYEFYEKNQTIGISFKHKIIKQNNIIPEITIVGYFNNSRYALNR
jgi:hypothetical protein